MSKYVVHVIESPKPEEILVEHEEGAALKSALRLMRVSCELYRTVTKEMLSKATQQITASHSQGGKYAGYVPFLHLSCHGNAKGIGLTTCEELIGWKELGKLIAPINDSASGTLLVGMSTCHGYEGMRMARTLQKLPFMLLVGPKHEVDWSETIVGFMTLYHRMAKEFPTTPDAFFEILKSVNAAAGVDDTFTFALGSAVQNDYRNLIRGIMNDPKFKEEVLASVRANIAAAPAPSES